MKKQSPEVEIEKSTIEKNTIARYTGISIDG